MDAKEIRELIEIISRSSFTTFELEREGFKLKLVRGGNAAPAMPAPSPHPPPVETAPVVAEGSAPPPVVEPATEDDGVTTVLSPIVGTFYGSASPGAPPFVSVGDRVKKGQVLCIVEAMKLMNEIESEFDAEVLEIVATNGQPVEYGDVLFRIRPSA